MNLEQIFAAIAEDAPKEIVVCDLNHTIIYMNKFAVKRYQRYGGASLLGKSLMDCHKPKTGEKIRNYLNEALETGKDSILMSENADKHKKKYFTLIRDVGGDPLGYYERYEGDAF